MYKRLLGTYEICEMFKNYVRCIDQNTNFRTSDFPKSICAVLWWNQTRFKKFQPLEVGSDPSNVTNKIQVKIINQKLNNMLKTLWKFHTRFHVTLRGIIWSGAIINFKSRKDESLSLFNFGRKYPFVDRLT